MKIFQVLNHFLPGQTAGTEVYTWALSKRLQQMGCNVEVIIPNYGQQDSTDYLYDGLKVFKYAEPSIVDRSLIMGFRKPEGLVAFKNYLEQEKPDVIHFHELAGSNGITLHHVSVAKRLGAKVLMTFHLAGYTCKTGTLLYKEEKFCDGLINIGKCSSCYLHNKISPVAKPLLRGLSSFLYHMGLDTSTWNSRTGTALGTGFIIDKLKQNFKSLVLQLDRVVVLTHWYKEILLLNGVPEEKIIYIPQGLPFSNSNTAIINLRKVNLPIRLMFLGRIVPLKGLDLLLKALRDFPEDKIILNIFGQSGNQTYEKILRNKTTGKANVHWKGKLRQAEVMKVMQQHDVLCLCSAFSEMSPLVIQEAFAAGIPVLASNVYGNAEQVIDGKNGWLFKFKDAQDLKIKLQMLLDDFAQIDEAKKSIPPVENFTNITNEYAALYNTMLGLQ